MSSSSESEEDENLRAAVDPFTLPQNLYKKEEEKPSNPSPEIQEKKKVRQSVNSSILFGC